MRLRVDPGWVPAWWHCSRNEVTTAYHCGTSGENSTRGLHFASREKMNTWVNCERDSVATGHGSMHLEGYSFVHQVFGQNAAVEKVLQPGGLAGALGFACNPCHKSQC